MNICKIYFDMDGVLADFNRGARELCGIEPVEQAKMTNRQADELFKAMRSVPHFYDKLEPLQGALELFADVYKKHGSKCEILSGIPKPKRGIENAGEDKINWAHRLIDKDLKVNIVYREEKKNYCLGPDYILIDDLRKNVTEWEAMGGTGIFFESVESTVLKLKDMGAL